MDAFPGFENIFTIEDPFETSFRGEFEAAADDVVPIVRAELRPKRPIVVRHAMGRRKPSDVIWTTFVDPIIVTRRVVELLEREGLTGWTTYPVQVVGPDASEIDGYLGIAIQGRCGRLDYSQSDVVLVEYPAGLFPQYRGLYFDPSSWDGSDFFMSSGEETYIFVTERARARLVSAKVRNLAFRRASDALLELIARDILDRDAE